MGVVEQKVEGVDCTAGMAGDGGEAGDGERGEEGGDGDCDVVSRY